MGFHHFRPGAKAIFNLKQLGLREFILQPGHDVRVIHPVVVVSNDGLRLRAIEIVQVRLRRLLRAVGLHVLIDPCHRELRQDVDFRHHDFKPLGLILLTNGVYFRFKGDQYVTEATLNEGGGGPTAAGIKHLNVFQELRHKLFGFCLIAAVSFICRAPCCQIGITGVTGCFRIREDQLHVRAHQIAPVVDIFRVALAHQERHCGVERRAVVRQTALPVRGDQLAFVMQDLHVGNLVIGHHVCFEPLQNGQSLLGGARMGLLDRQRVAAVLFRPLLLKGWIKGGKQLARDVIRAVEQLGRLRLRYQQH